MTFYSSAYNYEYYMSIVTYTDGAVFSYWRPAGVSLVLCAISACFSSWNSSTTLTSVDPWEIGWQRNQTQLMKL